MIKQEDAQQCFENICDVLIDNNINLGDIKLNVVSYDFNGALGKYDASDRTITISNKVRVANLKSIIAHEICHAIERTNGEKILTGADLNEAYNCVELGSELYQMITKLAALFSILQRVWTNTEAAENTVDKIDDLLEDFEDAKADDINNKNASLWKWFAKNYDKIYNAIDWYEVNGHNEEFIEIKNKLESILNVSIPLAEIAEN